MLLATKHALAGDVRAMDQRLAELGDDSDLGPDHRAQVLAVRGLGALAGNDLVTAERLMTAGMAPLTSHGSSAPIAHFGTWVVLSATVHGREDAVREVLGSNPPGCVGPTAARWLTPTPLSPVVGGQADLAEQHLQEGDRLLAPLPWWHRMLRVTTFQSAIADGWGSPVGPLRGDLAAFERDGDQQWVRLCRDLCVGRVRRPVVAGAIRSSRPIRAVGVTSRELDVLVPLASGRGNAAIAEQLFLSPRTVETHVASLLLKAGLTNRAELAGEWYRGLTP